MSEVQTYDAYRVDVASQRMLLELRETEQDMSSEKVWLTTSELRDAAGLEQNSQVTYRMEKYLIPAGLVMELEREERAGGTDAVRRFRLEPEGSTYVIMNEETLGGVATQEEVREMARTAEETAESARESVQSYRKKVSRLKSRVEQAEETVEETTEKVSDIESWADAARSEARDTAREVEEIDEEIAALTDRVERVEEVVNELVSKQSEADEADVWLRRVATTIGLLAIVVYLVVLAGVALIAPDLLTSVVVGGLGGVLGVAIGIALSASAR